MWDRTTLTAKYEFKNPAPQSALAPPYRINTILGEATIAPDGTFTVPAFANSPTLAYVSNAAGKTVGMALIDPRTTKIDRHLEAKTLAYINMKASMLIPALRQQMLEELDTLPEVDTLAADLNGIGVFEDSATQLRTALEARLIPKLRRMAGNAAPGMRIQPSNGKSGVEVLQNALYDVTMRNHYRRRTAVFVQKTEHKLPNQNPVADVRDITNFGLDPIVGPSSFGQALGDVGTLVGDGNAVFTSNVLWVPQVSDPVTLPMAPANAERTSYRVVVVGPGMPSNDGSYTAQMVSAQREKLVDSILNDFILPILLTAMGPVLGNWTDDPVVKAQYAAFGIAVKDLVLAGLTSPAIEQKFAAGDFAGGIDDLKRQLFNSEVFKAAISLMVNTVINLVYKNNPPEAIGAALEKFNNVMLLADIILLGVDQVTILSHWGSSKAFESFAVDVNKARVKLSPPHGDLSVTNDLSIRASVPDATGNEAPLLEYRWRVTSGQPLVDLVGKNLTGDELTSSEGDMVVRSMSHTTGKAVVEVEAFVNNPGTTNDVSLGTATCDIDVTDNKAVLTPAKASIKPAESQTFTVKVNNKQPGERFMYKWSCTNSAGKLTAPANTTAFPTASYKAGSGQGSDTVSVEVFKQTGGGLVPIGRSSGTILVEQKPTIIAASYSPMIWMSNVYAVVKFQKPAWASRFRLVGVGGHDYAYYGGAISVSGGFTQNIDGVIDLGSGTLGIALSLASGEPVSGGVGWMDGRFGGFSFYVEASP